MYPLLWIWNFRVLEVNVVYIFQVWMFDSDYLGWDLGLTYLFTSYGVLGLKEKLRSNNLSIYLCDWFIVQ